MEFQEIVILKVREFQGLYSRLSSYGGVYMDRTRGVYDYDDTNRNINQEKLKIMI